MKQSPLELQGMHVTVTASCYHKADSKLPDLENNKV